MYENIVIGFLGQFYISYLQMASLKNGTITKTGKKTLFTKTAVILQFERWPTYFWVQKVAYFNVKKFGTQKSLGYRLNFNVCFAKKNLVFRPEAIQIFIRPFIHKARF